MGAEASYLEWRSYRENECDSQEKCLTNGDDLACAASDKSKDFKKDTQLFKCSETCAIEHENAKAREADNETAERLRCMLAALFGEPDSAGNIQTANMSDGEKRTESLAQCNNKNFNQEAYWRLEDTECPSWSCAGVSRRQYWTVNEPAT